MRACTTNDRRFRDTGHCLTPIPANLGYGLVFADFGRSRSTFVTASDTTIIGESMKRLALVAGVVAAAACAKNETPATDTTTPAMAPAPMAVDSVALRDSIRRADSMRIADSTRAADSAKKAGSTTKRP
jgi:hypothetical protein